jgi:hypothetical protein
VLSMLEPWEKALLCEFLPLSLSSNLYSNTWVCSYCSVTIFAMLGLLLMTGLFKYLPHHVEVMTGRAIYYLWGEQNDTSSLWQWIGKGSMMGGVTRPEL